MKSIAKMTKVVTVIVGIAGLMACQPKEKIKYVEVEKPVHTDSGQDSSRGSSQDSCKTKSDYTIDESRVVQFDTINLVRERQMVRRYDCDGRVVSEKIEEVQSPRMTYTLKSKREVKGKGRRATEQLNDITGSGVNRQTCSTMQRDFVEALLTLPFRVILNGLQNIFSPAETRATMDVTLDYSPTPLTSEVDPGVQMIDYEFKKLCPGQKKVIKEMRRRGDIMDSDKLCYKFFEKGTLVLAVNYKEVTLDGVKEIKASDCKKRN